MSRTSLLFSSLNAASTRYFSCLGVITLLCCAALMPAVNTPPTVPIDIDPAENTVLQNAPIGSTVGITALSTDADAGTTLWYGVDYPFAINSQTGVVTVAGPLGYEAYQTVRIITGDGIQNTFQNFRIRVTRPTVEGVVVGFGDAASTPISLRGITKIAAGGDHMVALKADGTVVSWGYNAYGQTTIPASLRGQIVTAVAAGYYHTVALKADGSLVAWGNNGNGQTTIPASLSGQVVTAIAAGGYHTVALKADGTIVTWGYNGYGQTTIPASLTGKVVTAIAASGYNTMVLMNDGTVLTWGDNSYHQTQAPSLVGKVAIAIAVGDRHSAALMSDGKVWAWGDITYGQEMVPWNLTGVTSISAGTFCTIARKSDGTVSVWGYDGYGQTTIPSSLSGQNVVAVAANGHHALALKSDGTVETWGYNYHGEASLPPGFTNQKFTSVSVGNLHSVAIKNDGTLAAWGWNYYGQTTIPASLNGQVVKAVAAGGTHTLALKNDGTVVAWGSNSKGQTYLPAALTGKVVVAIAAGYLHSVALTSEGKVVCWGSNAYGQSNAGLQPDELASLISAGATHTLALKSQGGIFSSGTIQPWGEYTPTYYFNSIPTYLQGKMLRAITSGGRHYVCVASDNSVLAFGDNALGQTSIPSSLTGQVVSDIAAGDGHSVALKSDGTVVAWGRNSEGQINVPVGLTGVSSIAAGGLQTLAIAPARPTNAVTISNCWAVYDGSPKSVSIASANGLPSTSTTYNGLHTPPSAIGTYTVVSTADYFGSYGTATATFTIEQNLAPNIPVDSNAAINTVSDEAPLGSTVGLTVLATDPNQGTVAITYSLSNNAGGRFAIDPISGVVTTSGALKYETASSHTITVVASDGALSSSQNFVIVVTNVPELTPILTWATPVAISTGTALSATQCNATANVPGIFVYTPLVGTILSTGTQILNVTFLPTDTNTYTSATASVMLSVLASTRVGVPVALSNEAYQPRSLHGVVKVCGGQTTSVALKTDGTIVAWGNNQSGQSSIPSALNGQTISDIASGDFYTLVLKSDGTVTAFGDNSRGQINIPAALNGKTVTKISAGSSHNLVLLSDGSVYAWGYNQNGQATVPAVLNGQIVTDIAAGSIYSLALKSDGSIVAWGGSTFGTTTIPASLSGQRVIAIAAGNTHAVALKADGTVVAWGSNSNGQLNIPATLNGQVVVAISAGVYHTLALTSNGAVIAWGDTGSIGSRNGQAIVPSELNGQIVTAIAAGNLHSLAVKADGTLVSWGNNFSGALSMPEAMNEEIYVTDIAPGGEHVLVLKSDGSLAAWGRNDNGQCTIPSSLNSQNVTAIAAGYDFSAALKSDGTVVVWGNNNAGALNIPASLIGQVVTAIAAGDGHIVALKNDGSLVAWGGGDNLYAQTTIPTSLNGQRVTAIAVGNAHTVALKSDGTIIAWGANNAGQTTVPITLNGQYITAVAAGASQSVVLKADGNVVAWGNDSNLQCSGVASWNGQPKIAIGEGQLHTVALGANGLVSSIGYFPQSTIPSNLSGVFSIKAKSYQTWAIAPTRPVNVVTITNRTVNYDGLPKSLTITTANGHTPTSTTYNGSYILPSAPGIYTVIAEANYMGSYGTATGTLTITMPNRTPSISIDSDSANNIVPENISVGSTVGITASSTDPDGTPVVYSLSNNAGGRFVINSITGVVTVSSTLDYELLSSHMITVVASDGTLSSSENFVINISNVADLTPVITWTNPATISYGAPLSATQCNATANIPGALTYSPPIGTVLSAGIQVLSVSFLPDDISNYLSVVRQVNLTVNKATPILTWNTPIPIVYGTALSGTQLNATANIPGTFSYNPGIGSILTAGGHGLGVSFVPTDSMNYSTATQGATLAVNKATPIITWATPAPIGFGSALSITQLNATANISGSFTYDPLAGTVLPLGSQVLHASFTPLDTVNYSANQSSVLVNVTTSVSVAATDANASELTTDTGAFTFTRSGSVEAALTVNYTVSGTATSGSDFVALGTSVVIPAGASSVTKILTAVNDVVAELDETVLVNIIGTANYAPAAQSYATVIIADNEAPVITLAASDTSAAEQNSDTGIFTFTRLGNKSVALTAKYTVTGTATAGFDYTVIGTSILIPAGVVSSIVSIIPVDDALVEDDETVILTLAVGTGYTVSTTAKTGTVTIIENELPVITMTATDALASEPGTDKGTFTFTRTGRKASSLVVNILSSGTATNGVDYTMPATVSFAAGSMSTTAIVSPKDDTVLEYDETVIATITTGTGYAVGAVNSATVKIIENEKPLVTVIATDTQSSENLGDTGMFTFTRVGSTNTALTVTFAMSGTATSVSDYATLGTSVIIPVGATSITKIITPVNDTIAENDEVATLTIAANAAYTISSPSTASVTISDNEVPFISLVATDTAAAETNADPGVFTFSRTGTKNVAVTVNFTVMGTASAGADYAAIGSSVIIPAGATSTTVSIFPVDDVVVEDDETATLTLAAGVGYTASTTVKTGTVTIIENELPVVTIVATDAAAAEPSTNTGTFTFTRVGRKALALTVNVSNSGTATSVADYKALPVSVIIPAGTLTSTLVVTPVDNLVAELDETVIARIVAGSGYTVGSTSAATVIIADNEAPVLIVSPAVSAITEGDPSTGAFTITRLGLKTAALTVKYTVTGTATSGVDYTALPATTILPANVSVVTIPVSVINDGVTEVTETLTLGLVINTGYTLGAPNAASITVTDSTTPSGIN